jgi:polyisoprenoid-binding protein YceI
LPEITGVSQTIDPSEGGYASAATGGDLYLINAMVSRFTVQAFASGLLSAFGHNPMIAIRDVSGEARFNRAAVEQSSLHLSVKAASLTVTDNISDKDRRDIENEMREKVLEVDKYSEIVFDVPSLIVKAKSDAGYDVTLKGSLSLHGVTRGQGVPARITLTGDMLRAFGEFSLRQSDYGIKPPSAIGGGLKVKDEVKFTFDIVARKQA